ANRGYKVKALIFASELKGDAEINFKIVRSMRIPLSFIKDRETFILEKERITHSDLIIDALFGTGLKGEIRGFMKEVVSFLNETGKPILSVDCPSGLGSGIEPRPENCVKSSTTITFALPKVALVTYPGAKFVGDLYIADIGMPKELLEREEWNVSLVDTDLVLRWLAVPRAPDAHKGDFGHVLIIAGSRNTPGASVLVAMGALRSGAGLVTVGIPKSIHPIIATKLTESMTLPLPETGDGSLAAESEEKILQFSRDRADVVAVGPGVSLNEETGEVLRNVIMKVEKPLIIDADGITHLVGHLDILKKRKFPTVITPHPGEMARLVELSPREINARRIEVARQFSVQYAVHIVLKGASTVVGSPQGEVFINTSGNPAMSTGGMGDILTGLISGYIAQKLVPLQASILGVYLHGVAGDYLKEKRWERGILAADLAEVIPLVSGKVLRRELTDRFFLI
ncbi:MAG TPA: NAD(P)H-hydrate dehydratase, partial [Candidatus Omnitrophica bacterium]|nr:NAD(P)H-hydrate dehydratase [Candidatus Omnitrophota bacterium]